MFDLVTLLAIGAVTLATGFFVFAACLLWR
jgi:hypothetical protein